jgi:ribosomal-protein-alanine N-acetyltransferase
VAVADVIATSRLRVVPFSEGHLTERYVAWLNDPEVVRYSEQRHCQHTMESCREFVTSFRDSPNLLWAIEFSEMAGLHVGNIAAYVDGPNSIADVTILIGEKSVWGKGIGQEAWDAVCQYLLDTLLIRKVTAGTLAANHGMLSIMRRACMLDDGRRTAHYLLDGNPVDLVYAALFRRH